MDSFSSYSSLESFRSSGGSVRGSEERDISGSLGSLMSREVRRGQGSNRSTMWL